MNADELAVWRTATDEAVEQRLASTGGMNNQRDPDAFYAQVFTQCLRLATTHPVMHDLMFDPRLGEVVGTLAGVNGIRIWHDQALYKPPYGNPTGFHLDDPFWSFYSKDAISIWVALDDATIENGCLWYLPGTHKEASFEATPINENLGGIFKMYPAWKQMTAVTAPCKAGKRGLSQRTGGPRRRGEPDPPSSAGHDLRLYARRFHLQRPAQYPDKGILRDPHGGRSTGQRGRKSPHLAHSLKEKNQ